MIYLGSTRKKRAKWILILLFWSAYETLAFRRTVLQRIDSKQKIMQKILLKFYEIKYKLVVWKRPTCLQNDPVGW